MVRRVCIVLAVAAGLWAAVLIASDVSTTSRGEPLACTPVVLVAAVPDIDPPDTDPPDTGPHAPASTAAQAARQREVAAACDAAHRRTTLLAGLAVLACVGFGSVATFRGRPTPGAVEH